MSQNYATGQKRRRHRLIFDSEGKSRLEASRRLDGDTSLVSIQPSEAVMQAKPSQKSFFRNKMKSVLSKESLVVTNERIGSFPTIALDKNAAQTVSQLSSEKQVPQVPPSIPFNPRAVGGQLPPKSPLSHRAGLESDRANQLSDMRTATTFKELPIKTVTSLLTHSDKGSPVVLQDSNLRSEIIYKHSNAMREQEGQQKTQNIEPKCQAINEKSSLRKSSTEKSVRCDPFGCIAGWFSSQENQSHKLNVQQPVPREIKHLCPRTPKSKNNQTSLGRLPKLY